MSKQFLTLFLASTAIIAVSACSYDDRSDNRAPGKYEEQNTYTDSKGTTYEKQRSTEVELEDDGTKKTVVKSKTTKDPKGLFNKKTTSESKKVVEEKN